MFARVTTLQGDAKDAEKAIQTAKEQVIPKVKGIKGCKGFHYFIDRNTGKALGITYWDSKEDMETSEQEASKIRTKTAQEAGEKIVQVERYEMAITEWWG